MRTYLFRFFANNQCKQKQNKLICSNFFFANVPTENARKMQWAEVRGWHKGLFLTKVKFTTSPFKS